MPKKLQLGYQITVHAHPGSRRPRIEVRQPGVLDVYVVEPPEYGKANDAIREALAEHLKIKRGQIELIGGATSKIKRFAILDSF